MVSLAAKMQIPFPQLSGGGKAILGKSDSQWLLADPISPTLGCTRSIQCGSSIQPAAPISVSCPHNPANTHQHTHREGTGGKAGEDWVPSLPSSCSTVPAVLYHTATALCICPMEGWSKPKSWQHPAPDKGRSFIWFRLLQSITQGLVENNGSVARNWV